MLKSLERRLAGPLDPIALSRRGFLIGATAVGSSLVIGYASAAETPPGAAAAINPFDGYVKIDPDNRITVYSAHMDMGQGIYFGVATLVQDELDADWAKLDVVGGWGNVPLYNNIAFGGKMEGTGGSTGSFASWDRYRKAGATAREMLIAAAAAAWNVPAKDIAARKGVLSHASGKSATYGEMAAAAAKQPVPQAIALKEKKDRIYIGDGALPRYEFEAEVDRQAGLHPRRAPARYAHSRDDPSAALWRDLEELRCQQGEAAERCRRCRRDPARRRGRRNRHVGGDAGPQACHRRMG